MIFTPNIIPLKAFASIVIIISISNSVSGQIITTKDSARLKNNLLFYHSITPEKNQHTFQTVNYTMPKNELISWPDYPLTATQIEQRNEKWKQDNKLPNMIVKSIVQSIINKKKRVAVIPKF